MKLVVGFSSIQAVKNALFIPFDGGEWERIRAELWRREKNYEEGNSRDEERKNFFGEGKKEAAAFLERIDKPNAKYW